MTTTNLSDEMITTLKETIESLITTPVSPYRLADVTTKTVGYTVRPQVVYSYVRQGFIKGHKNSLGKWEIDTETARNWCLKYTLNNLGK
jgi:hypothetical protein